MIETPIPPNEHVRDRLVCRGSVQLPRGARRRAVIRNRGSSMRRILIVADQLLGATELRERLALKKSTDPEIGVFVLVPARAADSAGDDTGTESAERILAL